MSGVRCTEALGCGATMKSRSLLILGLALLGLASPVLPAATPTMHLMLRPGLDAAGRVAYIDVTLRVEGASAVRYRAPASAGAPAEGLHASGNGIGGLGKSFLRLPPKGGAFRLELRWDLGALGSDATATSSLGDGDLDLASVSAADLAAAYFMAGSVHRYRPAGSPGNLGAAWLEAPPFDVVLSLDWAAKVRAFYARFFAVAPLPAYEVFLVGGAPRVPLSQGALVGFDAATRAGDLELALSHEMLRPLTPRLRPGNTDTSWFAEGVAAFYWRVLPVRAGLAPVRRFLEELNQSAGRYYTNPLIGLTNEELGARRAADPRAHALPGDRGSLYLSILNAKIRAASAGKRSLDDVMAALIDREKRGAPADDAAWLELATREIGAEARTDHEAMLAGSVLSPDSDAFGPCFERTSVRLRRFELGFDAKSLAREPRIVHGVARESAAAHAGLRDGDEIVGTAPADLDSLQDAPDAALTLTVRRGGETLSISYTPRGESVRAYQWRRVTIVPDEACGL
jgi:hypothetical protein